MLCERSYDPLKDAVEGAMRGCKIWRGGGVTSNRDRFLTISVPSTQRRVTFQSPSARRMLPDEGVQNLEGGAGTAPLPSAAFA